jgi:hypothetical protein
MLGGTQRFRRYGGEIKLAPARIRTPADQAIIRLYTDFHIPTPNIKELPPFLLFIHSVCFI